MPVSDTENFNSHGRVGPRHKLGLHHDFTLFGEFDGVAH